MIFANRHLRPRGQKPSTPRTGARAAPARPEEGLPDETDSKGGLGVALVAGGKVRRFIAAGALDLDIHAPSPIGTSVTNDGRDRRTLLVTTGKIQPAETELDAHPASGRLFQARADVDGLVCPIAGVDAQQPLAAPP